MKLQLDLDKLNVILIDTPRNAIRAYFEGRDLNECIPDFDTYLDHIQGEAGLSGKAYLVIEVTR